MPSDQPIVVLQPLAKSPSDTRKLALELFLIGCALFTVYSIGVIQTRKEQIERIESAAYTQLEAARQANARAAIREAQAEELRKRMHLPARPTTPGEINAAQMSSL